MDRSIAAADRALTILEAFGNGDGSVRTLKELEKETGLFKSVICRYLLSFERRNYVTRLGEGRYQLGTAVSRLRRSFERAVDISQQVMPVLERLSKTTGESASYYVRNVDKRLCLYRVESSNPLRVSVQPGSFLPLDQSASATVLREFSSGIERAGSPESWVRTRSNPALHYASMAAPVFGIEGQLAGALTVSGPSARFNPARDAAVRRKLLLAAQLLSSNLSARTADSDYAEEGAARRKKTVSAKRRTAAGG
jgi:DNA-binding IclR family transcriptional regulator